MQFPYITVKNHPHKILKNAFPHEAANILELPNQGDRVNPVYKNIRRL